MLKITILLFLSDLHIFTIKAYILSIIIWKLFKSTFTTKAIICSMLHLIILKFTCKLVANAIESNFITATWLVSLLIVIVKVFIANLQ